MEMKKTTAVILIIGYIGICGWAFFSPTKSFSKEEKRFLQQRPELSASGILDGSYTTSFETYLNDQFPLRERWIQAKTTVERCAGVSEVNGVYFGKEGYLFSKYTKADVDETQYQKNKTALLAFTEATAKRLGQNRIHIMLVPSSSAILIDKLPKYVVPFDEQAIVTELEEALTERGYSNVVISLFAQLQEENQKDAYLYYRTDHHWTTLGAYIGYQGWCQANEISPLALTTFTEEIVTEAFLGTTYQKVRQGAKADELILYRTTENYTVSYENGSRVSDTIYDVSKLSADDEYGIFLGGNYGELTIQNHSLAGAGNHILLVKDSYANAMVPFLAAQYEFVHMIDLRYFKGDVQAYIEAQEITDVLVLYGVRQYLEDKNLYLLQE